MSGYILIIGERNEPDPNNKDREMKTKFYSVYRVTLQYGHERTIKCAKDDNPMDVAIRYYGSDRVLRVEFLRNEHN